VSGVQFSAQADCDVDGIADFISRDKPRAAARFVAEIERKCRLLARFPEQGQRCDDLLPGLRFITVGSYVIYYMQVEDGIAIVRVVSGFRDLESLFHAR
jgi:toxin ParE1/3/4